MSLKEWGKDRCFRFEPEMDIFAKYNSWDSFLQNEPWNCNALYGRYLVDYHWETLNEDSSEDSSEDINVISDLLWLVYPRDNLKVSVIEVIVKPDQDTEIKNWIRYKMDMDNRFGVLQ